MNVLVIGGGGREHALAWKLAASPRVDIVHVAPGNAGTATEPGVANVAIAADDIDALVSFAADHAIDLTVVGPEAPLVAGVVDRFTAAGLRCLGPVRAAAQLEGSKAFSKEFMLRHGIPTARFDAFTDLASARAALAGRHYPLVVKADGLAAGKGVVIAADEATAQAALEDMLVDERFGAAGRRVVIEDFIVGEEASFICLADGESVLPFATSQDHKARDDGDRGPNTGGMGAYSPAPVVTGELHQRVMDTVIRPTLAGMVADGHPYRGFLYAGLMIDADGVPQVLEFNCRFGDPETQPIMMRLKSDLFAAALAAVDGGLEDISLEWDPRAALGVVVAAGGYPGSYENGKVISGLDATMPDSKVFHAGTRLEDGKVLTSGGRVLCVVGLGETVGEAQRVAYARTDSVSFDGGFCRRDIGYRAIARERGTD
ncbi:MAG: phosphoribosylamine--glycine ligase [Gammaproteobacteria bacterium]|nr:phosphoribosylamine--glycine ligase [Gammaproteobacteria bacterium]NNM01164.1 phosphoribosylamine--glycine ligase [Gammaproteobacteria bacterium]